MFSGTIDENTVLASNRFVILGRGVVLGSYRTLEEAEQYLETLLPSERESAIVYRHNGLNWVMCKYKGEYLGNPSQWKEFAWANEGPGTVAGVTRR